MTTITGFADGLLDGTIPDEKRDEYLTIISNEAKRLSRLVRKMLDTSRLQALTPAEALRESFDLSEVIRVAVISLEGKINGKGLDVDIDMPEEEVTVRGDKDAITQVVYNLIDNATKFAYSGTTLSITMEPRGEKVFVSVKNTGDTIPPQELPLLFDRFHKTDKSRSEDRDGVGLGLYIVKTIVNSHNEDITVTSRDGVTEFVFTLTKSQQNA
jgi:signal transduction histidine kinase